VADEQDALAALPFSLRTWVFGYEIACAGSCGLHGHPANVKAEGLELRRKNILYRFHAGQVHGAAVDIDDLLEKRLIGSNMCVDGARDLLFDRRKRWRIGWRLRPAHGADREHEQGDG